jgi:hypothetical protein
MQQPFIPKNEFEESIYQDMLRQKRNRNIAIILVIAVKVISIAVIILLISMNVFRRHHAQLDKVIKDMKTSRNGPNREMVLTKNFQVAIDRVSFKPVEKDAHWLVIDLSVMNTDSRTHAFTPGYIVFRDAGDVSHFNEIVSTEGTPLPAVIKGLTSITTRVTFKIPGTPDGNLYYHPDEAGEEVMIGLGNTGYLK